LAVGWIRSYANVDLLFIQKPNAYTRIVAFNGTIGWREYIELGSSPNSKWTLFSTSFRRSQHRVEGETTILPSDFWRFGWNTDSNLSCGYAGFVFATATKQPVNMAIYQIPHWSIVLPLTLLSAYLLLLKPRSANKPAPPTEPDHA